ncbi:MAG TPA: hypothetical protein VGR45_05920 [Stellaceae bacterium]|nr:hypothetical protein [Stellaceae bacterium]
MSVKPRGIRSPVPPGTVIGRASGAGTGAAQFVPTTSVAAHLLATGMLPPPGAAAPLVPIADGNILANISGATAAPIAKTPTSVLDYVFGSTQGDILYRDAAAWKVLAVDTAGKSLLTGGAAANPSWGYPDAGTLAGTTLHSTVVTSSLTAVGTIATGVWQGTKVGLPYGGTNADLSATGGTSQVLKQTTLGAAVTVAQLAASDLSNGTTGSGAVVLATSPTLVTPALGVATATSINKVAITAPLTGATLTIADGKTLTDTSGVGADLLLGATGGGFAAYAGTSGAAHQWLTALSAAGAGTFAQPATGDLSDISTFNLNTSGTGSLASLAITGTVAAGYIALPNQSGDPAAIAGNIIVYTKGTGHDIVFKEPGGNKLFLRVDTAANGNEYSFPVVGGSTLVGSGDTGTVTNTMLANSSLTIGSTNIALGATSTVLAGLTSITATGGSLTGLSALSVTPTANTTGLAISGISLTGSNASSGLAISGTWNTTGNPNALLINMTNTASGTSSQLINAQVAGVTMFNVTPAGAVVARSLQTPSSNYSQAAWTTAGLNIALPNITITDTTSSGTVAQVFQSQISQQGIAASNPVTYTKAVLLHVGLPPVAGTNVTITSGYSLDVAGAVLLESTLNVSAAITGATTIASHVYTVGTLPTVGTAGRRAFVSDATATTFASIVAGTGANGVPVYDDGTNWRIG